MLLDNLKLSIIVPVFNEVSYIGQCIESIMKNRSNQFEVIIYDNCSSDGTGEVVKSYKDNRIRLIEQKKKISSRKNHINAIEAAIGEYIFIIGGDDYFTPFIIDKIIPQLNGNNILVAKFNIFIHPNSKKPIGIQNGEEVNNFLFSQKTFLPNYLNYINHDTIMFSFIPQKYLKVSYITSYGIETFWTWMAIYTFAPKDNYNKVSFVDDIVFNKRYHLSGGKVGGNYSADDLLPVLKKSYFFKALGSIYNSFYFYFVFKDFKGFTYLLINNRSMLRNSNEPGGFYGRGKYGTRRWYFGPLITFFLSPIIDAGRIIQFILKESFKAWN